MRQPKYLEQAVISQPKYNKVTRAADPVLWR